MIGAPLVYVGPTLSVAAVSELYPGCIVRPPIRRGDLYRDRMLRGAVFLILDGVFHQNQAISPREILDVLADGALVAGASSMGAMRAAECWPAGMRGVGSIYRLFRRGELESDDEVAVAFAAEAGRAASSVPLVNVRYAAWQAQRTNRIDGRAAARLVECARAMFYPERHWPAIVRSAALHDRPNLCAELAGYDLKALDARRALARVRRWLCEEPSLLERPRATTRPFAPSEEARERTHDARQCMPVSSTSTDCSVANLQLELAHWLFASGRYLQHAAPLLAAIDALPHVAPRTPKAERTPADTSRRDLARAALESADSSLAELGIATSARARAAYIAVVTHHGRARALLHEFTASQASHAELVWLVLSVTDELDAELFHLHALRAAAVLAREQHREPTPIDRHAAELRIATTHGFPSWNALLESLAEAPEARALVVAHGREAAFARAAACATATSS